MPEFLQVILARAFGYFCAERGIAALAAVEFGVIGALRFFRQGKESAGQRPSFVQQRLIHAMVAHHGKAEALKGLAERAGKIRLAQFCHGQDRHLIQNRLRHVDLLQAS
jgi:hypothetical protein